MINLRDIPLGQIAELVAEAGQPSYRVGQLTDWLHNKRADSFEAMTNLPADFRAELGERFSVFLPRIDERTADPDGTEKLLLQLEDGNYIESVLIPMKDGKFTICISSQVGCRQHCRFCRTGAIGLTRNLTPGEIVGQVIAAGRIDKYSRAISNIVLMGMGEPLDNLDSVLIALDTIVAENGLNFSHRKVTVSTCGLVPQLKTLGQSSRVNLAVSLNASDDETRSRLMPVNNRYNLRELFDALGEFVMPRRKRVTFEYVLIDGVNDTRADVSRIATLVGSTPGLRCKFNLIALNPSDDIPFTPSPPQRVEQFQQGLLDKGISAFIRTSHGASIQAACGQLAAKKGK